MAVVTLEALTKVYDRHAAPAAEDVSLEIGDAEFMVLLGPSGCGKTTTLRMIAGLESITSGRLSIDGQVMNQVPAKDRDIAMVFQSYALYPHMTVKDNLAFGLKRRAVPRDEIERRVAAVAETLELTPLLRRRPHALSGGQRQRVALGRAIVRDPKVFLFDEPLSNLDAALRVSTRSEIAALHRRLGATMIYVTHDQVEAMTLGTRICIMSGGRVMQVGKPLEVYHRPVNTFVAGFLGNPPMNLIASVATDGDEGRSLELGGSRLSLANDRMPATAPGTAITFGIRPEDVALRPRGDGAVAKVTGRVAQVEALGAETIVTATLEEAAKSLTARIAGDAALAVGDTCDLFLDLKAAQVFGADGNALIPPQAKEES